MCRPHTRFVRGSNPSGGVRKKRNGTRVGEGRELGQTLRGLLQVLEGRAQAGRGPLEAGSTPSLDPVPLGLPWRRHAQAGGRQALAREGEMP